MEFIQELNNSQQEAVRHTEGPSLVIAGAGSGKTRVLTYRIAYLLSKGVPAYRIMALTFTNKAAREMQRRISHLVGEGQAANLWMGTFHSMFLRILRNEASALGYSSNFTIYDTQDARNLIKSITKELKLDEKVYKPAEVMSRISMAKNNLITAEAYAASSTIQQADSVARKPRIAEIYRYYEARCKRSDVMDFDDLLLQTNILFRDFPEILQKYQQKFDYILVDEYQDTNYSQYLIIKRLAEKHRNICVVGDDAQSIYSFRGARIENILNFRNDYPGFNMFKLEQNYRSTATIVEAANSIIQNNKEQIPKKLFSENGAGDKIRVLKTLSDKEEGFQVANEIFRQSRQHQQPYDHFAILYRTNAQSRIMEEALRRRDIPYRIYGGLSFYQRKEVKDLLAYLRLVTNLNDEEALRRVINYPRRGIGETTVERIRELALRGGLSMWEIISHPEKMAGEVAPAALSKLEKFRQLIDKYARLTTGESAYEVASQLAKESGIVADLSTDDTPEGISRKENIQEMIHAVKEYSQSAYNEGREESLSLFLQGVALMTDQDKEQGEEGNQVTLMTIHSSKGLEFETVFLVGLEEELFPSQQCTYSPEAMEEERRLFYVALTRAEKRVVLSYTGTRYRNGSIVYPTPSRFIKEIPGKYIEGQITGSPSPGRAPDNHPTSFSRRFSSSSGAGSAGFRPAESTCPERLSVEELDPRNLQPINPEQLTVDLSVYHPTFGSGKVLLLEGTGINRKATVYFKDAGKKTLLLKFAKLFIQKAGKTSAQ